MKRRVLTGLLASLLFVGTSNAMPASVLRVQTNADIRSTDPGVNRDANTDSVVLHMVEGLVGYDVNGEPQPLLAERIDISDDGLEYTFHLRDDVNFHNGEPFTADDVLWSWNRYMDPDTGWRCLSDFDGRVRLKVENVKALDEHTVQFQINHPSSLFLSTLARNDCGMTAITHRDSLNEDGTWDKPIGTGPFKFNEWRRREFVSMVRNDDYSSLGGEPDGYVGGKRPLVDELRFIVIPDAATAKAALQSGTVDVATRLLYAEGAQLADDPDITLHVSPTFGINNVVMLPEHPLFENIAMRRAIAAAIDYKELAAGASYGLAEPNNSIVPSTSPYHKDVQKVGFDFDPDNARALLAEAGYDGEQLTITANQQYTHNFDIAVVLQMMLKNVGINTNIEVVEWGTLLERWQSRNYELLVLNYSARMDAAISFESIMGPKNEQPRKVWEHEESLALLDEAMRQGDPKERQRIFDKLHENAIEQIPVIPVFNTLILDATTSNVSGYRTAPFGTVRAWEVEKK